MVSISELNYHFKQKKRERRNVSNART